MSTKQAPVSAGFDAEALDPAITAAIDRLTKSIADIEKVRAPASAFLDAARKRAEELLEAGASTPEIMVTANQLVEWLERYARVALSLTKVTDEAARLRSFVAGGADSRPDVGSLSDAEISVLLTKIAAERK